MTRLAKPPKPARGRSRRRPQLGASGTMAPAGCEGPQHVTVHGREEVVVIGADEFQRLTGDRTGRELVEAMQASPHRSTSLEPARARLPVRDVQL